MEAQEAGAVEGGPAVNADKVIEWVTHVMGVTLTSTQKDLIRHHFGKPTVDARTQDNWAAGGRKFAELLVGAYCEEMDHADYAQWAQGFTWKQAEGGYPPPGEAARIPDRVFMDDPAVLVSGGLRSIEKLREENDG